jgi:regulator of sigma E protease
MFLVMIHEFGHYFAAKRAKVKVLEFGIGIPPKLKTFFTDTSGTEWTANWIPL